MVRKRRPSIASSTVALSVAALVAAATALPFQIPAYAGSRVRCGDVLTKDTSLDSDLIDCPGDGLIIGADGITVRLNDHEINAASLGTVGIRNVGHDDVTIIGGVDSTDVNISGFGIGVLINDADRNEVSGGLGADDGKYGIAVIDSDQSAILKSQTGFTSEFHACDTGGPAGIVLIRSDGNRIVQNDVQLTGFGILLMRSDGNHVIRNTAAPRTSDGNNCSGIAVFGSDGNAIKRNLTANNDMDGIFVNAGSDATVVEDNVAVSPGAVNDDGIDANSPATTITGNTANRNGDLGIEAVPGVTDGGGNTATGNGDPRQCVNVVCS